MGVFFEQPRTKATVQQALRTTLTDALMQTPPETAATATEQASELAGPILELVPDSLVSAYQSPLTAALRTALMQPTPSHLAVADVAGTAAAAQTMSHVPDESGFRADRFMVAVAIFAIVVGAALGADAGGLSDSSKALYGFAASIFGVIVGLLGGEKSSTNA
jgi:hypothetical protein